MLSSETGKNKKLKELVIMFYVGWEELKSWKPELTEKEAKKQARQIDKDCVELERELRESGEYENL
jgi:hypothetical protein